MNLLLPLLALLLAPAAPADHARPFDSAHAPLDGHGDPLRSDAADRLIAWQADGQAGFLDLDPHDNRRAHIDAPWPDARPLPADGRAPADLIPTAHADLDASPDGAPGQIRRRLARDTQITDLWAFIEPQTASLGHIDGEGHCDRASRACAPRARWGVILYPLVRREGRS